MLVVKGDWNGAVSRITVKRVVPFCCMDGHVKEPTKCLWCWEPDRRSNFFFGPPVHLCAITHTVRLILTLTILFYSILQIFYSILFYSVFSILYSILSCCKILNYVLFCFLFYHVFYSILFYSILYCSLFYSILFSFLSIVSCKIQNFVNIFLDR